MRGGGGGYEKQRRQEVGEGTEGGGGVKERDVGMLEERGRKREREQRK